MKRRKAIKISLLSSVALSGLGAISAKSQPKDHLVKPSWEINVFSKHLHWAGYDDMAKIISEIGFDGVDLTVRPGGHVEPEHVERDLPVVAEACDKQGIKLGMMTTAINSVDDPKTEPTLKVAAQNGIKVYRLGWYKYDFSISIPNNIEKFNAELKKIAELNAKYGIIGDYQNHSGTSVGSAVWDIVGLLDGLDSSWIGVQYDIRHAMIEGLKSWTLGLRAIAEKIHSIDIKDYEYVKTEKGWNVKNVPLGEGNVNFVAYFKLLEELKVKAPISLHLEYSLGGAERGKRTLTIPKEEVITAMARDLNYLRSML